MQFMFTSANKESDSGEIFTTVKKLPNPAQILYEYAALCFTDFETGNSCFAFPIKKHYAKRVVHETCTDSSAAGFLPDFPIVFLF